MKIRASAKMPLSGTLEFKMVQSSLDMNKWIETGRTRATMADSAMIVDSRIVYSNVVRCSLNINDYLKSE